MAKLTDEQVQEALPEGVQYYWLTHPLQKHYAAKALRLRSGQEGKMPRIEVELQCKRCGKGLCPMGQDVEPGAQALWPIEPCVACLADSRLVGYEKGYKDGLAEGGEEDGKAD